MGEGKVGAELACDDPDVAEPARDGVDGLREELLSAGALLDDGALGVAGELEEERGDGGLVRPEVEGGHACIAAVEDGRGVGEAALSVAREGAEEALLCVVGEGVECGEEASVHGHGTVARHFHSRRQRCRHAGNARLLFSSLPCPATPRTDPERPRCSKATRPPATCPPPRDKHSAPSRPNRSRSSPPSCRSSTPAPHSRAPPTCDAPPHRPRHPETTTTRIRPRPCPRPRRPTHTASPTSTPVPPWDTPAPSTGLRPSSSRPSMPWRRTGR